jgi:hypothetical protein
MIMGQSMQYYGAAAKKGAAAKNGTTRMGVGSRRKKRLWPVLKSS